MATYIPSSNIINELIKMSYVNAVINADIPDGKSYDDRFLVGDKVFDGCTYDPIEGKNIYFLLDDGVWKQQCACTEVIESEDDLRNNHRQFYMTECTCPCTCPDNGEWVDNEIIGDMDAEIIASPTGDEIENNINDKFNNQPCKEAIVIEPESRTISHELHNQLVDCVIELSSVKPIDWHPESNEIVNDLIHPSMYSLRREPVRGFDFWGREYEDSYYQWLPSDIRVTDNDVKFISYINNLPEGLPIRPYEQLLNIIIPHWESMYMYARTLKIQYDAVCQQSDYLKIQEQNPRRFHEDGGNEDYFIEPMISLRNRTLQVVPKIVDMVFKPQSVYEGVWHFEGMSHENIVMTAIYFLRRDEGLEGGVLQFKRAFSNAESNTLIMSLGQERFNFIENLIGDFVPLGQLSTDEGRLIVFPNSHAHRITKIVNTSNEIAHRQIIVFFLINPEVRITSTADIPPQQSTMTYEQACFHRLELMKERKFHKQSLNTREVNLCEH